MLIPRARHAGTASESPVAAPDTRAAVTLGQDPDAARQRTTLTIQLHHSLREIPIQANRVLALVSMLMTLAERWGLRPDGTNPCRHVERFRERKRERYLSADELARPPHRLQGFPR